MLYIFFCKFYFLKVPGYVIAIWFVESFIDIDYWFFIDIEFFIDFIDIEFF